jgi:hypothetical protein
LLKQKEAMQNSTFTYQQRERGIKKLPFFSGMPLGKSAKNNKKYELRNHLGNVLVVVSDKKIYNCGNNQLINANFDVANNTSYNNIMPTDILLTSMNLSGSKLNVTTTTTNGQVGGLFDVEGEAGRNYQVDFDITGTSGAGNQVWFLASSSYKNGGATQYTSAYINVSSTSQHITFNFTAPQGLSRFKFGSTFVGSFSIDNFVVKEAETPVNRQRL